MIITFVFHSALNQAHWNGSLFQRFVLEYFHDGLLFYRCMFYERQVCKHLTSFWKERLLFLYVRFAYYYSLNNDLNYFFANQYAWIHIVVMYFVPFSYMFVCKMMTMKKLIVRRVSNNAQRNHRESVMLLWMCLAYVIFTLPNRLCFSVFSNQIMGHPYTDTVFLSSNTLMYTRNALNVFFLYMSVVGFRRSLHQLLSMCYTKCTNQVVWQDTNNREGSLTVETVNNRF